LDFFKQQIQTVKFINIYRPIIILLDKILQSGLFNNNNFSTFLNEIFLIADTITEKCLFIINNINLELNIINNNNFDNFSGIYIYNKENYNDNNININNSSNLEAKNSNEIISIPYNTFYFWYIIYEIFFLLLFFL
jgi:hypothetical protein